MKVTQNLQHSAKAKAQRFTEKNFHYFSYFRVTFRITGSACMIASENNLERLRTAAFLRLY